MLAVSSRRSQLRFFKQIASDLILGTHCGCVLGGALSQRRSDFNPEFDREDRDATVAQRPPDTFRYRRTFSGARVTAPRGRRARL